MRKLRNLLVTGTVLAGLSPVLASAAVPMSVIIPASHGWVSASKRIRISPNLLSVGTNVVVSTRIIETNAIGNDATRIEYCNCWLNAGVLTAVQELGTGSPATIRLSLITNMTTPTQNNYNQATLGASVYNFLFSQIQQSNANYIQKIDNTTTPPTVTHPNYTQFQADGGSITASGSGATIVVPDLYSIDTDWGSGVAEGSTYAIQMEDVRPTTIPCITQIEVTNTVTCTVTSTATLTNGIYYGVVSSTPSTFNVSAGNVPFTVVDATHVSYTDTNSGLGTATTPGAISFVRPAGGNALNVRGDIVKQAPTTTGLVQSADWSSVSNLLTGDGQLMPEPLAAYGKRANGNFILVLGDSLSMGVGDYNRTNPPSGATLLGDSDAVLGYPSRALNAARLSFVTMGVAATRANNALLYGDDNARLWAGRRAGAIYAAEGRNDATVQGSYSLYKGVLTPWYAHLHTYFPGKRLVTDTYLPLTSVGTSVNWSVAGQTQAGNISYPAGYVYANLHVDYASGAFIGVQNGGPDAVLDAATPARAAFGAAAVDGLWPVDGNQFDPTAEGQHPSKLIHAAIAAAWTPSVVYNAYGVAP